MRCEDFYEDFSNACREVIDMDFDEKNKMSKPLLAVPEIDTKNGLDIDGTDKPRIGTTMG